MRVGWKRLFLILGVVGVALALGYLAGWVESGISQPIAFPHKTHLALGLTCTTCHQRAEKDIVAGRPPTALCLGCHMAGDSKSEEIKKLKAYGEEGQEIPWKRVWRLPSHVFFSHQVHVTVGQLTCQTCHGPMETLTRPPVRAFKEFTMDDCIECHAKRKATKESDKKRAQVTRLAAERRSADCIVCHR